MDFQPFINVGLSAAFAVLGWVARTFYTDIRALESAIAAHKVEVARDYATNEDISEIKRDLAEILRYMRK
jgi:cobyric acid synthase